MAQSAGRAGRVDADHAIRPDAQLAQLLGDPAGLADRGQVVLPLLLVAHRRGVEPDRRHHRADHEPLGRDLVGHGLEVVVADVDVDVRVVEEDVDAVELDAVDLGRGGQVEHRVQVDRRLGAGAPLADQAGPHRVVQFRERVGMAAAHRFALVVTGHGAMGSTVDRATCSSAARLRSGFGPIRLLTDDLLDAATPRGRARIPTDASPAVDDCPSRRTRDVPEPSGRSIRTERVVELRPPARSVWTLIASPSGSGVQTMARRSVTA